MSYIYMQKLSLTDMSNQNLKQTSESMDISGLKRENTSVLQGFFMSSSARVKFVNLMQLTKLVNPEKLQLELVSEI